MNTLVTTIVALVFTKNHFLSNLVVVYLTIRCWWWIPRALATGLWMIDSWPLSTLSPSLFELATAAGAEELGVAFAAWDLSSGLGGGQTLGNGPS